MAPQLTRFGDVEIAYDDELLEPRDWTVEQSHWAIELLAGGTPDPVLELCAGAGQIGLLVARVTGCPLVQVDDDERACAFARRNAVVNDVVADVRCAPIEAALSDEERFHLVLADPPYVPAEDVEEHPEDPDDAIDGGDDGLELARRCLDVAARHLTENGLVLIQLGGAEQAAALAAEAADLGLAPVDTRTYGRDRSLLLLRLSG